ncbi:hypothetical protein Rhopal_001165-T1 [Rhodotorula paludigena]|uniref:Uncharacterized protein n=1 Tax=Rhodotorula paludigena TaxID=86838 RepID=A0AAV5GEX6_9BASI|nr:hypothetical protein Rhopal_001165-T1 [Rhodotorula paludigena]
MGIFHKKDKSPSGFFTVDESDAHHPEPKRESTSTASPRASTDSPSAAAAAAKKDELKRDVPESREKQHPHHPDDDERREGSVNTLAGEGVLAVPAAAAAGTAGAAAATAPSAHATAAATPEPAHAQSQPLPAGAAAPAPFSSSAPRGLASAGGEAPTHIRETAAAPHGHHEQPRHDAVLSEEQAKLAQHDHKYLQPVVHERRHIHEVEEVERHRVVDRHVHHVQHHVQPLLDERHLEVVHSFREVPVTHVEENHASTDEDRRLLARLNAQSVSSYTVVPHERTRIDKGETQVTENVVHHYHTIVMPVWQRDLHEFYRLNSNFSPETMITPSGAPLSSSAYNPASPPVQGAFATASHPPGARIVPGGPSLSGPPQPREGHKLVPDDRDDVGGESTRYEVEFVNREPVFAQSHHRHGPTVVQPHAQQQQTVSGLESGVQGMNLGVAR